jgi:hypothetical protein
MELGINYKYLKLEKFKEPSVPHFRLVSVGVGILVNLGLC